MSDLKVGAAKVEITPQGNVWMDGMPRSHESEGVHDPIYARAVVVSPDVDNKASRFVIVSCDVCALDAETVDEIKTAVSEKTGIPAENMVIAVTHTHSGPSLHGFFNPKAEKYEVGEFVPKLINVICDANEALRPAMIGWAKGIEDTISYYRRLKTVDGKIIMNWEEFSPDQIVGPAEEGDSELGVVKIVSAEDTESVIAVMYSHAGHPNVMSGENFQISGDYPGLSSKIIEDKTGGIALFLNAAQGSMDIDGLKDRDWEGVDRTGKALAAAAQAVAENIDLKKEAKFAVAARKFGVPIRQITPEELDWATQIMQKATGEIVTLIDGVGDEWKAELFLSLDKQKGSNIPLEMTGIAIGDVAFLSFPGELFTEIGQKIKAKSPFAFTYIIDMANDYQGYFPTQKAIGEGGYAVETRNCDAAAGEIIIKNSLEILEELKQ